MPSWGDPVADAVPAMPAAADGPQALALARGHSTFASGWRPGIGWVCVAALACQYVARPLIGWIGVASGHPLAPLPGIDDNLWQLVLGMLGLGGLRTFEKLRGVHSR